MKLREYQSRILDDLWDWFHKHDTGNPIVNAVVGAGKSVLIAALAQRAMTEYPGTRILVIVHQKELLQQNLEKIKSVWPGANVGIHSASVGKKDLHNDIIYATIGSIYKKAHLLGRIDLVLADECFVAGTKISTPSGDVNIEDINVGDVVFNQIGTGVVEGVSKKESDCIYSVEISNGEIINCTGNHPFFTERGWKKASELENGARLFCSKDMLMLWERVSSMGKDGRMDSSISDVRAELGKAELLLREVCKEIKPDIFGQAGEDEDKQSSERDPAQAYTARRERAIANLAAACSSSCTWGWMGSGAFDQNDVYSERGSSIVQSGYSKSVNDGGHRSGREQSLPAGEKGAGREEDKMLGSIRVVSVSRIKREGITPVFNIQVSGHPSYFANGVAVHNCHLINSKEAGSWRLFLSDLKRYNPMVRTIGWTGTPFRGDGVWLTAGDEALFSGVAAKVTMRELLDLGYLAPLTPAGVKMTMSAEGVAIVNGDYKISDLAARVDREDLVDAACDEMVHLAADRKRWLVFCVTVAHARHVCDALKARGVVSEVVSADTPKAERERIIEDFRAGRIRALCNVAVLTTGFDVPAVDCIALLRNTRSPVLYVQIAGRGMRVLGANIEESAKNGKSDCLWMDFTDTTANLGPVDAIQGRGPKRKLNNERPVKLCESCGSINAVSARVCIDCGAPFDIQTSDPHGVKASDAAIMSGQKVITRYTVDRVTYAKHQKPGKPPSLRAEYWNGLRVVAKEWVAIESDSQYGRGRAVNWWMLREPKPMEFVPRTVDQCIEWIDGGYTMRKPSAIMVSESGKYPEILSYEWKDAQ